MFSFKSIYFVLFYLVLNNSNAQISDKRLCVDPECTLPVSKARSLLRFSSPDPRILSFGPNQVLTIFSKHAGSDTSLWGAELDGVRGYVPRNLLREYKVLNKATLLVDTELKTPEVPKNENVEIVPDKVQDSFEVVDGTTIYNPQVDIKPSAVDESVKPSVIDNDNKVTTDESLKPSEIADNDNKVATDSIEEPKKELRDDSESTKKESEISTSEENVIKEESVVENVLSTFSNWINDGNASEEDNDEDDDGDEDVEDDDDEENEEEIDKKENDENLLKDTLQNTIQQNPETNNLPNENSTSTEETDIPTPFNMLNTDFADLKIASYNGKLDEAITKEDTIVKENDETSSGEDTLKKTENEESASKEEIKADEVPSKIENVSDNVADSTSNSIFENQNATEIDKELTNEANISGAINVSQEHFATSNLTTSGGTIEETEIKVENPNQSDSSSIENKINENSASSEIIGNTIPNDNTSSEETKSDDKPNTSQASNEETLEGSKVNIESENKIDSGAEKNIDLVETLDDKKTTNNELGLDTQLPPTLPIENNPNNDFNYITPNPVDAEINGGIMPEIPNDSSFVTPNPVNAVINEEIVPETVTQSPTQVFETTSEAVNNVDTDVDKNKSDYDDQTKENIPTDQVTEVITSLKEFQDTSPIFIDKRYGDEERKAVIFNPLTGPIEIIADDKSPNNVLGKVNIPNSEPISIDSLNELPPPSSFFKHLPGDREKQMFNDDTPRIQECFGDECEISEKILDLIHKEHKPQENSDQFSFKFNLNVFGYFVTTAISVILFLLGYVAIDKRKRESPLLARINKLEKELLLSLKENELLQQQEGKTVIVENTNSVSSEVLEEKEQEIANLQKCKLELESQIQALEKELDTSTEVGMELNRIVSEMLNSSNGSDTLKANVEQLQRQLVEQQDTINTVNEMLSLKETENHELNLELDIKNKKVTDLQDELNKLVEKVLKIEEERDLQQNSLEAEIISCQQKYKEISAREDTMKNEILNLKTQLIEANRNTELKIKEFNVLKGSLNQIKSMKTNSNTMQSLLDVSSIKAELLQLKNDNQSLSEKLEIQEKAKNELASRLQDSNGELESFKQKYEQADKDKVEINTKLEVLNNYFKEKEAQLLKEISKYESIWEAKEGEASSTTERIKYIQEELQNYKTQNESLKNEIVNQEVELKSQISMLEKKVHENWVAARQTERKLDDARQEAAQLRNRLTMRERETIQNRMQSPLELNGEHPLSPQPIQSPASPPLLYGGRDHLTKSPPIPGLPPFLPPPPGAPFMPPPIPGMPPFMPPPPSRFPGDHRPPPLGRMSSPPLNSRYSPESTIYSEYDRNSPSPPYDSEYGTSPPMRAYSPYNDRRDDRRDYKRQTHNKVNGRNNKGSTRSSGSEHSNESLEKINRKHSKV